jgi:hypothetical protein
MARNDNIVPFRKPAKPPAPRPRRAPVRFPPATVAFVIGVLGYFAIRAFSPWPVGLTLRHLAAAPNCDAARLVGLAPARTGEPGYWANHDADHDGIACEPYTRFHAKGR